MIDFLRWTAFWTFMMTCAVVVWPFYVLRNLGELLVRHWTFRLATALIAADQAVKLWAVGALKNQDALTIVPGWFDLRYAENIGAAFSIFPGKTHIFVLMAIFTVVVVLLYSAMMDEPEPLIQLALAMVVAGAIGNLMDRLRLGCVIDYLHVFRASTGWEFPIFNLADSVINIGVGLIAIDFVIDFFRTEDVSSVQDGSKGS